MSAAEVLPTPTPTVSLSTLAKAAGPISPVALTRLLRGHKYQAPGPRRSYQNARRQAISLLVDKAQLDPDAPLRAHERDVLRAMARTQLPLPPWIRATRPTSNALLELHGVQVSMQPDVELHGSIESGAAKFSFTKDPLPRGVGSLMAALLWYGKAVIEGDSKVKPSHCLVYEPRLPWVHRPAKRPLVQLKNLELACTVIHALWASA